MMRTLCFALVSVGTVLARQANMQDVEAVAAANKQAAEAVLEAAKQLPTPAEQLAQVSALNAQESGSASGGAVRDYSFLAEKAKTEFSPAELLLRGLVRRGSSQSNGQFSRKTQSPLVWMHYHSPSTSFAKIPQVATEAPAPMRIKVGKSARVYASDRLLNAIRGEIGAYMAGQIGSFMQELNQKSFLAYPINAKNMKDSLFTTQQLRMPPATHVNVVSAENTPAVAQEAAYIAMKNQERQLHANFRRNLLKMRAHGTSFLGYSANNAPMTAGNTNFAAHGAALDAALPVVNIKYTNAAANTDPSAVLNRVEADAAFNRRVNDDLLQAQADAAAFGSSFLSKKSTDFSEVLKGMAESPRPHPYQA